ncbi:MAG: YraN family protein [Planctomycetota bacterium]
MLGNLKETLSRWIASSGFSSDSSQPEEEKLGARGEKAAARFLKGLGYRILAHGHRQKLGEIDLIALDGDCIVFVEVKTWRSDAQADPSEAVDRRKQERITRAALIYLKKKKLLDQPARFDVISIVWPPDSPEPTIRHFTNAFEAVGSGQMYR